MNAQPTDALRRDEYYMRLALTEASAAAAAGEPPVGALLVRDNEIIVSAHNLRETDNDALAHAELICIKEGCRILGNRRLSDCELYVTLEPCPMCAGACVNSLLRRVIFGAADSRAGAFGSVLNLNAYPLGHRPSVMGGVLADECAEILRVFFKRLRK